MLEFKVAKNVRATVVSRGNSENKTEIRCYESKLMKEIVFF